MTQQLVTLNEYASLGLAASTFPSSITDAIKTQHLTSASGLLLGYLAKAYTMPLVSWGDDLREKVAAVANFTLMRLRGFDPTNPADQLLVKGYDDAIAWARDVARGLIEASDIVDSTPTELDLSPLVSSDDQAGWQWATASTIEDDGL